MALSRRPGRLVSLSLAVFALSTVLYANTARNGLAHDDFPLIRDNPLLWNLGNVPSFFTLDYFAPHGRSGLYRPLVTTSYALDRALYGSDVGGFHVTNTLLHGAVSVLVLLLVWSLTRAAGVALATGLLFAAHAVHTESVASLSLGRPDLLAALFGLLTLQLHVLARRAAPERRWRFQAGSVVCYGLGLLCKESAVTVLGLVFLIDWVYPPQAARPSLAGLASTLRARFASSYLPLLLLTGVYLGARVAVNGPLGISPAFTFVDNPLAYVEAPWRIVNATWILFRYLGLFLLPLHLSHDYSYDHIPLIGSLGDPRLLALVLLVVASAVVVGWCYRKNRGLLFAIGFFLISISVGSNVAAPITTMMGERVLYFPSVGLCLAFVLALRGACEAVWGSPRARTAVFVGVMGLVVALNGWRTVVRNPDWRDMHTIRLRDVAVHPRNAKLQTNAGYSYRMLGQSEQALEHFDAAIAIVGTPERWVEPFRGKVVVLIDLGRIEEARAVYGQVSPELRDARDALIEAVLSARPSRPEGKRDD